MARDFSAFEAAVHLLESDLGGFDDANAAHTAAEGNLASVVSDQNAAVQAAQQALAVATDVLQSATAKVKADQAAVDTVMANLLGS